MPSKKPLREIPAERALLQPRCVTLPLGPSTGATDLILRKKARILQLWGDPAHVARIEPEKATPKPRAEASITPSQADHRTR